MDVKLNENTRKLYKFVNCKILFYGIQIIRT